VPLYSRVRELELDRRRLRRTLLAVIAVLSVASLLAQVAMYPLDYESGGGLIRLFNANGEANIPAYYSALALLACGVVFGAIGATEREASRAAARRWTGLAVVAALASLDEAAGIHETVGELIDRAFSPGGYFYFVWVIPAAVVVLAMALAYRPFVAHLEPSLRRALVLGAALWAGSALFLELVEGRLISSGYGVGSFRQGVVGSLQETGEMLGLLIILDGLLRYLAERKDVVVGTFR